MINLRWYQEEAINAIWHYFMVKNGNPVIGLPTGSGKTLIPVVFIQRVMKQWPDQRFLMLSHIKELIEQSAETMKNIWPNAPLGLYSAGLNKKDTALPIIFAGIQSAIRNAGRFGHRDIIFVDEVHMVSDDETSMYRTFLAYMKAINPNVKFIGMSATLYRMGLGTIIDNGLFTDIIYDMTDMKGFNRLIDEGYLSKLIPKRTVTQLDISNVGVSKGEFKANELQKAVDIQEITFSALKEAVEHGYNREAWLIFASGIEHSDHIAEMLGSFGIQCASVHSKQTSEYNDKAIKAFKAGELRALSSFSKLATGFDHPKIDLIIDLRPTLSIPLHVQKYGRGTRIAENKNDCLVLDFARNTQRLGCINDPVLPKKKGEKVGDPPVKICEHCGTYNYASARTCVECGAEFEFKVKIFKQAGTEELLREDQPIIETFDVDMVFYAKANGRDGKPDYVVNNYHCGMRVFRQNVFPEAKAGLVKHLFKQWWMQRSPLPIPLNANEVLMHQSNLRPPRRIQVHVNKKYPEVMSCEY